MPHIRDVVGAHCPMGCGQTLHLMPGGMLKCLARMCPEPGAAQEVLSDPEHLDVVEFHEGGYAVLHPLRERLSGRLFDCPVDKACAAMDGPPPGGPGRYRAWFFQGGLEMQLERLPSP